MYTASLADLKDDLKLLFIKRYLDRGYSLPKLFFSDDCCEDRALLLGVLSELEGDGLPIRVNAKSDEFDSDLPIFEPGVQTPSFTTPLSVLKLTIQEISDLSDRRGEFHVSIDIEKDPHFMNPDCPPCLIQIEAFGKLILWKSATLVHNRIDTNMPDELLDFLSDPKYIFFGNNINWDITNLRKHCK